MKSPNIADSPMGHYPTQEEEILPIQIKLGAGYPPTKTKWFRHLFAMLKRNWIQYRRTWFSSLLEMLLPILLMSILAVCRDYIGKTVIPPQGYENLIPIENGDEWINATMQHYPFLEDFYDKIPLNTLLSMEKN